MEQILIIKLLVSCHATTAHANMLFIAKVETAAARRTHTPGCQNHFKNQTYIGL